MGAEEESDLSGEEIAQANRFIRLVGRNSDVYAALIQNAPLIARDIQSTYIPKTGELIESLLKFVSSGKATRFDVLAKSFLLEGIDADTKTVATLESLRGRIVASFDGGQGSAMMGSVTPFLLRGVTYSVRIGDQTSDRESFEPSRFYLNRLTNGSLGTGQDLLGAIQLLFELKCVLKAIQEKKFDYFLMHGPLVRSLGQYSNYQVSYRDVESIFDDQLLFKEFQKDLEDRNKDVVIRKGSETLKGDYPYFAAVSFVLRKLLETAEERRVILCGVVERSRSTEVLQRVIFDNFDQLYKQNASWFGKATGYSLESPQPLEKIRYTKKFIDNLGYTDPLLLGVMLQMGEYTEPIPGRANKSQSDNRELGLDTGFISGLEELTSIIPNYSFSYIRTSPFNLPFRVEFPAWLSPKDHEKIMASVFAFSQFLPRYAFPINLDTVDKLAKVPQWLSQAMQGMILQEIYESKLKDAPQGLDYSLLLGEKMRDWDLRPQARRRLV